MTYVLIFTALVTGVAIGAFWHHRFVLALGEQAAAAHGAQHLIDEMKRRFIMVYTERDPDSDVIRLYEVETGQFVCQAATATQLNTAFTDRYPDKKFFIVETDSDILEELGIDPDNYDTRD